MKKPFPLATSLVSLAAMLCISLLSSCTTNIEPPPPPPEPGGSSSSAGEPNSSSGAVLSSSSVAETKDYCVYQEIQQCYPGPYSVCPGTGGILGDSCPYSSSSTVAASSSSFIQDGQSSSGAAAPEYGYCVFAADRMCFTGPLSVCPPGGTLSNDCPYSSSSSSLGGSSSSALAGGSSSESQEYGTLDGVYFTDPRDGKKYKYAIAPAAGGGQIWMSENLNYSRDNTLGYCYGVNINGANPHRDSTSCGSGYGRHYAWDIAMDGNSKRGLCPKGWHIPSVSEWTTLGAGTPSSITGTRRMSSAFYIYSGNYDYAGYEGRPKDWYERGMNGFYWTNNEKKYFVIMGTHNGNNYFHRQDDATNEEGYSIRCVADDGVFSVSSSSNATPSSSSAKPSSSSAAPSCEYDYKPSWCGGLSIDKISKPTTNNTISENGCFFVASASNVSPGGNAFSINGQAANPSCWSFEDCTNGIEPADGGYYFYKTSGGKWQIEGVSKNSPSCPSEVIVESCGEMNATPVVGDLALSVSAGSCMRTACSSGYLRLATYSGSLTLKLTGGCSNANYQPRDNLNDTSICRSSPGIVYIEVTSGTSTSFEVRCY